MTLHSAFRAARELYKNVGIRRCDMVLHPLFNERGRDTFFRTFSYRSSIQTGFKHEMQQLLSAGGM